MKNSLQNAQLIFCIVLVIMSCRGKNKNHSDEMVNSLNLKRGNVVLCGPPDKEFGSVMFNISCPVKVKSDFNLATALLHSFEYDQAEKVFAKIIDEDPGCAMAYWGVAMSNFHALWAPPNQLELAKGSKAIEISRSLDQKTKRESDYIEAIATFYKDWDKVDHHTRCINFEKAMERVYLNYPNDKEAAIFYALALNASANLSDKTFPNQRKALAILNGIFPGEPNHPGIAHYIIHTCDYPELAELALPAARKYASIAPSSAHAQHMPSHIYTRLGLWDESIHSNLISVSSAKCYAENAGLKGHWDEELHAMDYLVYSYLQKGENDHAKEQLDYLKTINEVYPVNFKVAYAFAAIPSRYLLENKMWQEAAHLEMGPADFPWDKFPWQKAIIPFTRTLGSVQIGDLGAARTGLQELKLIYDILIKEKDTDKANKVLIQVKTADAWILFKEGKNNEALKLMNSAADMEDGSEKHPVTPGEVLPARELLGDMLMQMDAPAKAFEVYQADLKRHPNRFNGLYGAGLAAEKSGNPQKADLYYRQLLDVAGPTDSKRSELNAARLFIKKH